MALGVNVLDGRITHPGVAEAFGMEYTPLADVVFAGAAA
jgi:alanine dehydrogenase